jgi:hypothetical protein
MSRSGGRPAGALSQERKAGLLAFGPEIPSHSFYRKPVDISTQKSPRHDPNSNSKTQNSKQAPNLKHQMLKTGTV